MKRTFLFLLLFAMSFSISAQTAIPNGNFETWDYYNTWTLDPQHWQTSNGQLIEHVFPDSNAYEGEVAMEVNHIQLGVGEYGAAICTLNTDGVNDYYLNFHVKTYIEIGAGVGLNVYFLQDSLQIFSQYWGTSTTMNDWTPITMDLSSNQGNGNKVVIEVYAAVGDLITGFGWISVDAMYFSPATSVEELDQDQAVIYPNPVNDRLKFEYPDVWSDADIQLYDSDGKLLLEQKISPEINIQEFANGVCVIRILKEGNVLFSKQLIIAHD